ncbi:MAG: hypothetical protein RL341_549, partial [Pseudomonadota bacterium]
MAEIRPRYRVTVWHCKETFGQ